jgi:N-acetylglucosamine kinase-like BadF-type ATPase
VERAIEALEEAIGRALQDAKTGDQQIAAAVIGLAGTEIEADRLQVVNWLTGRMPDKPVDVVHDTALVLAAGTPGGWGLVIISGTGSVAFGRDRDGREVYAGRGGRVMGDEGSAYAIGIAILKAIACANDGRGPKTLIEELVYEHLAISGMEDLVRHGYRGVRGDAEIAGLAPLAEIAALAGDPVACEIIKNTGAELAKAAWAVASRLAFRNKIPCALGGSTITKGQMLADAFAAEAVKLGLDLHPVKKVPEPAIGALLLARRLVS